MDVYFQTADGFGVTDSVENIPPGGTQITQVLYEALRVAREAEQAAAFALELAAAHAAFIAAYDGYRLLGIPVDAAIAMAGSAGIRPPDWVPTLD